MSKAFKKLEEKKMFNSQLTTHNSQLKGFLAIEYLLFIAIVVAALLAMQLYIKRAICGRWRDAGDSFGHGRQYEPGLTQKSEK